jgi:hypothetical protein
VSTAQQRASIRRGPAASLDLKPEPKRRYVNGRPVCGLRQALGTTGMGHLAPSGVDFSRAACPSTPEIERRPANYAERHVRPLVSSGITVRVWNYVSEHPRACISSRE